MIEAPHHAKLVDSLRFWNRIHIRLTVVYGIALLFVLTPAAAFVYQAAVRAELENLWARIHMTTVSLAAILDGDRIAAIQSADDPLRERLRVDLQAVLDQERELASVYIFRPTERPNELSFVVDVDRRAAPGAYGELYDGTPYPELTHALAGPAVEHDAVADAWGTSISGFAPIRTRTGKPVAIVGLDIDAARVEQMKARLLQIAVVTYLAALGVLALVAFVVGRALRKPMIQIIDGTEAIARGSLETRVALERKDELGTIGQYFDRMAAGLEEREFIRATFGRYVSEDVARKLLADRGKVASHGEERDVTILFSDLRGYSTLSETMSPNDILDLMNQYFEAVSMVVSAHGGVILEYLGDGVLAVFGAPDDLPGHAERAVRCALMMRERLVTLNREWDASGRSHSWRERGIEHLRARIGVHTGPVVAGSMGSRFRMKYTVIGDTVNIAARLEALNVELGTDILVSRETFNASSPESQALATAHGDHVVKGRAQPVSVYSL